MTEQSPRDIAPQGLRAHVIAAKPHGHAQPADAVHEGPDDLLERWHRWEHTARGGWPTHMGHAHDEFTAHREGVPMATVRAHCERHDHHIAGCAACVEAIQRSVQEALDA